MCSVQKNIWLVKFKNTVILNITYVTRTSYNLYIQVYITLCMVKNLVT